MKSSAEFKSESWEKIGPLPGILYGEMIAEVLKRQNIPYNLVQDGVATAYGLSGTSLAGNEAYIFVPQEYKEKVREIINQLINHI